MTIGYLLDYTLPTAFSLLPPVMGSRRASAMLLAIGLQETRFTQRHQVNGPAVGYWQFELPGIREVLTNPKTQVAIDDACRALDYDPTSGAELLRPAILHNDVLAACFARCLLWTSPVQLCERKETLRAWDLYVATWRPGKPRRRTWTAFYQESWARVAGEFPPADTSAV